MDNTPAYVQQCAEMRAGLLRWTRDYAPLLWAEMMRAGSRFLAPQAWSVLPEQQRANKLAQTKTGRIAGGPLYALDGAATAMLARLARSCGVTLTAPVLPAASGTILFDEPIATASDAISPIRVVTFGPPPPGMHPGVWLSWWSDVHTRARLQLASGEIDTDTFETITGKVSPLQMEQESSLPYAPLLDSRLGTDTALRRGDQDALVIRTVALAWLALSAGLLPVQVHQPDTAARTVLRKAGAKDVGVHVVDLDAQDCDLIAARIAAAAAGHNVEAARRFTAPTRAQPPTHTARDERGDGPDMTWIPRMQRTYQARLQHYENSASRLQPGVWQSLERLQRTLRGRVPSWAPLPIGVVMELIRGTDEMGEELSVAARAAGLDHQPDLLPTTGAGRGAALTALALWRRGGRTVYFVHPDALREDEAAEVLDADPRTVFDALKALPGQCIYLATSDADGVQPSGLFLHLERDEKEERDEIRLLLDLNPAATPDLDTLLPQPVHVTGATLTDAVDATWSTTIARLASLAPQLASWPQTGPGTEHRKAAEAQAARICHLLAAALFLIGPDAVQITAEDIPGLGAVAPGEARLVLAQRRGQGAADT